MRSRRDTDPADDNRETWRLSPPELGIGREMPCHAFTDKLLLLARGERIVSDTQLERLARPDVIFSSHAPPHLAEIIRERQISLGLIPSGPRTPPQQRRELPDSVSAPAPQAAESLEPVPLAQEVTAAHNIRATAMHQMEELAEQARAGESLDLQPVRGTVSKVVASLRRNEWAFASLLQLKSFDTYTYTHSINNCVLGIMLAQHSGLAADSEVIGLGALMHDIGKVRLPETVLNKPGNLTEAEWEMVKQHPTIGAEMVHLPPESHQAALDAISQHHERLDGSGYPAGLRDAQLSAPGRMVAIADVYDAMTSHRPYHPPVPAPEAMRWIFLNGGELFDPELVRLFVGAIGLFPVGSLVRLNTQELAVVATVNRQAIRRPSVIVVSDPAGTRLKQPSLLDLEAKALGAVEIAGLEDPDLFGINVQECLALGATLSPASRPRLDMAA